MIDLIEDHPARLATLLHEGTIDIGLVPVASLVEMEQYHIVSDYCIGTEGEIASVCLFSEVPMQEIKKVYLDYQSRSSVALLQWLIREYWGIQPELVHAEDESYREKITGTTAGLVIGDRAFEQRKISTFIYDLGSEWRSITGLPFVFAAWVSKQPVPQQFIDHFNAANAEGMSHIDEIVADLDFRLYDLKKYYNLHVSYLLDDRKKRGMELFLQILREERGG